MRKIHTLVRYIEISDGNMQEGSFRCDANVSIRPMGDPELGTRTELKNINSFRFVEQAINIEIERQIEVIEGGGRITQETRLFDPDNQETRPMRSKEEANDYRYFPDPDLLPVIITEDDIEAIRKNLPELPKQRKLRFIEQLELSEYDAQLLTSSKPTADYFEAAASAADNQYKLAANWVIGELTATLRKENLEFAQSPISPTRLAGLLIRIADGTISGKIAKQVFETMWQGDSDADQIIDQQGLKQISDESSIEPIIDKIVQDNPKQVGQFQAGQTKLLGFFVGQVMKATQGKANPKQVNILLNKKLNESS